MKGTVTSDEGRQWKQKGNASVLLTVVADGERVVGERHAQELRRGADGAEAGREEAAEGERVEQQQRDLRHTPTLLFNCWHSVSAGPDLETQTPTEVRDGGEGGAAEFGSTAALPSQTSEQQQQHA